MESYMLLMLFSVVTSVKIYNKEKHTLQKGKHYICYRQLQTIISLLPKYFPVMLLLTDKDLVEVFTTLTVLCEEKF